MTMMDLRGHTEHDLDRLCFELMARGNIVAANAVADFQKYYNKSVKVVKGRKVPKGTTGTCFWMGQRDYSKYGDPWGIYTVTRIGIKTETGEVFWTALDNVELV